MCLPSGARLGSTTPGWVTRQYGPLGVPAGVHVRFAACDLLEGPADVDGHGPPAARRRSRGPARAGPSRPCRRPARSGSARAPGGTARRQAIAGHGHELARRHVEHDGPGRRQVGQALDQAARLDPTAERGELGHQGVDDRRAAALDDGPAVAVRQRGEEAREHAGERRRQRQHGVRRGPRHQRPPFVGAEASRPGDCAERRPRSPNAAAATGCAGGERMEPRKAGRISSRSRTSGVKRRA